MRKLVNMRQALEDPAILGSAFSRPAGTGWLFKKQDVDTRLAWRALLIAIVGEELTRKERRAFESLTKRSSEPLQVVEEFIAVVGRRGGKTLAGAVLLTFLACLIDWSSVLNVGERAVALCLAQNQKQATISLNYISGIIENSPMLKAMVVSRTADTISLRNGVDISVMPSSFRSTRGVTAVAILADELAFWPEAGNVNDAASVLNALRPSLATTGGMLIVLSSPYSKRGELWELYSRHFGAEGDPAILVAQGASRDLNPTLPERVVARALERDRVAATAEYLGQFRDDNATGYIDRDILNAAIDVGVTSRPPSGNHVCFLDAASGLGETKDGDRYAMAIGHVEGDVVVIDHCQEWLPPFNASSVTAEACGVIKQYGISEAVSDGFSSGFLRAELARNGVGHRISEMNKSQLYLATLPMLTSRKARLLDLPTITDQFAALERRPSTTHDKIDAKGHEDGANCCAGVIALLSAAAPMPGWGIFQFYKQQAQQLATDQLQPPTLAQEHGAAAVMQIGNRPARPEDHVRVQVPAELGISNFIGASGATYLAEIENGQRVVWCSESDALRIIDSALSIAWRDANIELRLRLKESAQHRGDRPPAERMRWSDVMQAVEDARPRAWNDKGGHVHDALRAVGRWPR